MKTVPNSQPAAGTISDSKYVLFSICKCLNMDTMSHRKEAIPSPQERAGAPVHPRSTTPEPDWTRSWPLTPRRGLQHCAGQPDHHTPCWVCYWQHHLTSRVDWSCPTLQHSVPTRRKMLIFTVQTRICAVLHDETGVLHYLCFHQCKNLMEA